jgi:hypothetical protein
MMNVCPMNTGQKSQIAKWLGVWFEGRDAKQVLPGCFEKIIERWLM